MPDKLLDIGTNRQLFLDGYWIENSSSVERILHSPESKEVVLYPEKPWEEAGPCYFTVFPDGGKYRGWYRTDPYRVDYENTANKAKYSDYDAMTAYVESDDGINWTKPSLGLIEWDGSKDNNLIWKEPGINFSLFKDNSPNVDPSQLYKGVIRNKRVLLALASPDGTSWNLIRDEPILTDYPFDTHNIVFWDSNLGEYVIYARGVAGKGISDFFDGVRWIRRATSKNYLDWSKLENIDCGDVPFEHFYTNSCIQYDRAPGTYLMFPSRFVHDRVPDPEWNYDTGVSDIVFMSSRDGMKFDRSFMEGFIRPGLDFNNWHDRGIFFEVGILHTSDTEMSMYGMENSHLSSQRIRRYTLRTDGFVSMNAKYSGGEFTTKPFKFDGNELELNYSTSAVGSVRVEVQRGDGSKISGFGLDDCPEKFGDEVGGVISWNGGSDVGALAGSEIRLRFQLKDADLYAFKFN